MLTARMRDDVELTGYQKTTQIWWQTAGQRFELLASEYVIEEATRGDSDAAQRRLAALQGVVSLIQVEDAPVQALATKLVDLGAMPAKARFDALHVAVCACAGVEFLVSWNFKHLANAQRALWVEQVCRQAGYEPPRIITPLELLED